MRLALLIVVAALGTVATAYADDIVILPPVGAKADASAVSSALSKANAGTLATKTVTVTCTGDPSCLATTGAELGAKRIVAINASAGGKLEVSVVDVGAKLLLGTRVVNIPTKKLGKELGPTLGKLIEDITVEKAKGLFAQGNEHYNLGEFKEALELYKLAYRVKPLPAFQFNIAQCHRKLGQHKEAIAMYQAYLVGVPDAPNKAMVDSLIAESRKAVDEQSATDVKLQQEKMLTEQKKAEEARKAKEAEAAANAERAKTEQARIAAERDREKTYNKHPMRKWMIATSVLAAGAIGAGGYFGLQSKKAQESFDAGNCGDPMQMQLISAAQYAQCEQDRDTGQRDARLANAFMIGGGAALVGSIIIFAIDPGNVSRPESPRTALRVSPRSIQLVVSW